MVCANFTRSAVAVMTSLMVLGAVCGASAQDAEKATLLATVNGKKITTAELGLVSEQFGAQVQNMSEEQKQNALTNTLVDMEVIAQEAEKQGLDQSADFKKQVAFMRSRALQNEFFRVNVDETITDTELKSAYDEQVGALPTRYQVKARHILLKTEDEAKAVILELDGGADFAELAKTKSTGPSGPKGGDLGYFGPGQMVPQFEAAAFALETGNFTKEPVQTQFGWHVILNEDKKEIPKPAFEQVETNLRTFIAQQKFSKLLADLRAKAKIELAK